MNLKESSITVSYAEALKAKNLLWEPSTTYIVGECAVAGACEFLKIKKSKEDKVAMVFKDYDGTFKCAFMLEYTPANDDAEDGESPDGNYNLTATFNEADLSECGQIYDCHDMLFASILRDVSIRLHRMQYNKDHFVVDLPCIFFAKVAEWLDVNAKENETVTLEADGYFEAAVSVENGHKIVALTPGAIAKQIIKDDLSIQN